MGTLKSEDQSFVLISMTEPSSPVPQNQSFHLLWLTGMKSYWGVSSFKPND